MQNNVKNKKSTAVVPSMSSTKEANEIKARKFWLILCNDNVDGGSKGMVKH